MVGNVFKELQGLTTGWFSSKENQLEFEAKVAEAASKISERMVEAEIENARIRADLIKAEMNSKHWFVAAWRPLFMMTFLFIILNNYVLYPYLNSIFGMGIELDLSPEVWDMIKIGFGFYIPGRSIEKAVEVWSKK